MSTKRLGGLAERVAATFLEMKGYSILATNYRHRRNELDIVARDGRRIVFVEVKCRSGNGCGLPREAVGYEKRRRILRAARGFILEQNLTGLPARFDVIEVLLVRGGLGLTVDHIVGAFGSGGGRW